MLCFLESEIPPLIIWSLPVRIYPGFSIVIASASFLMTTPLFDVKIHVRRISFLSSLCQQNHYVCKIIMSAGRVWKFSSVAMCSLSQFLFYRHFQGLHREIKVYHVSLSGKSSQLRFAQLRFWLCGLFTIRARVWSELYKVWSATRRGSGFLCKNFRIFMVNILNGYTLIPLKFFSGRGCFLFFPPLLWISQGSPETVQAGRHYSRKSFWSDGSLVWRDFIFPRNFTDKIISPKNNSILIIENWLIKLIE